MNKDLDKIREIFLSDVDEETKADNLAKIQEWETALHDAETRKSWLEHDTTKKLISQARKTLIELGLVLANNRDLTERQRESIYARQDAMVWILSFAGGDVDKTINGIQAEIKRALEAV